MKCPNCQNSFRQGKKCPHCGVDTVLYLATVRLSDKLYNQGLERLKAGDFFHGISTLTKSISINKNNVPARNVLGLALYEVGHVGEALKHWIISKEMLKDENPAARYIDTITKNARRLESLNDAVEMYNQALSHIKQKSDDLAIIQLKKAVEINPRFVDALNLLTLCYLIQNERERATAMAERVVSIDAFNPVALNYYTILNPGRTRPPRSAHKPKDTPHITKGPYKPMGLEEKKPRNFHFAELFMFLIGVAVTVAAGYFLVIPAFDGARETERQDAEQALADARVEFQAELNEAETAADALRAEIASLNESIWEISADLVTERRINHVNHAYMLFNAVDAANNEENLAELRRIVNMFDDFDRENLLHDTEQRIDAIFDGAYPRLGLGYYNAGLASFNPPRDSYMALVHLENARRFLNEDDAQWDRMLFMLGVLYYDAGGIEAADEVLSELYERNPNLPHPFTGTERTLFGNMLVSIEAQR